MILDDIRAADGMADYTMTECERQRRYLLKLTDTLVEALTRLYHDGSLESYNLAQAALAEARK